MQLAVSPSTPGIAAADLVALCRRAEGVGYESAWLAEVAGPESFSLGGAIAAATELSIGIGVVPAGTRTPAVLAMGAATLSQLSGGRPVMLGIGSSSQVIVESWHGGRFSPPLVRVREAVEATRTLLSGDQEYTGSTVSTSRFRLASPPEGPIGLLVGALGPKMLRLAGAVADGVCLNLMPESAVPEQIAQLRQGAAASGRSIPEEFIVMARFHTVVTDDVRRGRDLIRGGFGPYFAQPVYNRFLAWCGWPEEAEAIRMAFAAGDRSGVAAALHDDVIDGVALIGPAGLVRERLAAYGEAGVTVGAINVLAPDAAAAATALEQLAPG
jgi:probable F420-dependent oxidoreductase